VGILLLFRNSKFGYYSKFHNIFVIL